MFLSVIVPVHNAAAYLKEALSAIRGSDYAHYELIVVDDGSSDGSRAIAEPFADKVLACRAQSGAGAARNQGAALSRGDILFFIDADVKVRPDTLTRAAQAFRLDPGLAGLFGSYDDAPTARNFSSQFKNLLHHYVHQQANPQSKTFWAGCGALRRGVFRDAGGFVEEWKTSAIEDVILGMAITQAGGRIRLLKDLQVKHLKSWSFVSLVRTDIMQRAVPWSRLALEKGLPRDLNFKTADRWSAVLVWGALAAASAAWVWRPAAAVVAARDLGSRPSHLHNRSR